MIPFEVMFLLPAPDGPPSQQARDALVALEAGLAASARHTGQVLALTFFVDSTDQARFLRRRDRLLAVVRNFFDGAPPATSIVAQAPEGRCQVALEATVLASPAADVSVTRRTHQGLSYTVVTGHSIRQIHAGGIVSKAGLEGTAARARGAFETMEAILDREAMGFREVVRQWNYLEGMLAVHGNGHDGHQGYQDFNDVRTLAYGHTDFSRGYPAATGIGQAAGGVLLEFLAVDGSAEMTVMPLSNPRQTDAHHYSPGQLVGEALEGMPERSTPKFERAKLVARAGTEMAFVSGTAAILGEKSVAPGDVAAQTKTTIENMRELLGKRRLTHLRGYVKHKGDIDAVRRICADAFGPIPALFVRADICRNELLVELEGAAL